MTRDVKCTHCQRQATLTTGAEIYPYRSDLHHKRFWLCRPCRAYVGCHATGKGTQPLGTPANARLRALRSRVHAAFDPRWKQAPDRKQARTRHYRAMSEALGIPASECHVGMFDEQRCRDALAWLNADAVQEFLYGE